jgi:Histone methylation protein DOT1
MLRACIASITLLAAHGFVAPILYPERFRNLQLFATTQSRCTDAATVAAVIDTLYPDASDAETDLLGYTARLKLGREAQGYSAEDMSYDSSFAGELTYGEFSLNFAQQLIGTAAELHVAAVTTLTFLDIGSGVGRLVCLCAMLLQCSNVINIAALEFTDA